MGTEQDKKPIYWVTLFKKKRNKLLAVEVKRMGKFGGGND